MEDFVPVHYVEELCMPDRGRGLTLPSWPPTMTVVGTLSVLPAEQRWWRTERLLPWEWNIDWEGGALGHVQATVRDAVWRRAGGQR